MGAKEVRFKNRFSFLYIMNKGFTRYHMIGTGLNYESRSTSENFDIIVKDIDGPSGKRTATIKVIGRAGLDEIILTQGGKDRVIAPGVIIGMAINNNILDEVNLYHYANSGIEMTPKRYIPPDYE